ncbi:MAG TPA: DNA polymerase ligase N-terminal domain-containing protein [Actinomycetota bacterium]|nr:DNA polymerase ligase N-terminal domain-containing protein [Actinomycetota bacterium]
MAHTRTVWPGRFTGSPPPMGSLEEYRRKRTRRTPEPSARRGRARRHGMPRFVIQQHDATSMHWDVRLEAGGVLKSWAVPKGPSTDPRERRLAMPTEDHPLDYAGFEGVIPPGEYGAGSVIVWDAGTYRNLTEDRGREVSVEEGVERGHVKVFLEGRKLRGGYALTRTTAGARPRWILMKLKDEHADARRNPVRTEPRSVLSGVTIEEQAGRGRRRRSAG